jgi:hypothetical protein
MGDYFKVSGHLKPGFISSSWDDITSVFASASGFPPVSNSRPADTIGNSASEDGVAWRYSDSWRLIECNKPTIAVGSWVNRRDIGEFLELVRRLAAAFNQTFLDDDLMQMRDDRYPLPHGGTIWVEGLMGVEDHQCWVIREGIVHVYDKDTPLVKNWINAVRGPIDASSP